MNTETLKPPHLLIVGGALHEDRAVPSIGATGKIVFAEFDGKRYALVVDWGCFPQSDVELEGRAALLHRAIPVAQGDCGQTIGALDDFPVMKPGLLDVTEIGHGKAPDLTPLRGCDVVVNVLTHSHFDHYGALPLLGRFCRENDIDYRLLTTLMTKKVSVAGWLRSLRYADREGGVSLYSARDVRDVETRCSVLEVVDPHDVQDSLSDAQIKIGPYWVTFFNAGHIVGAVTVLVEIETLSDSRVIFFSGDMGMQDQRICPGATAITRDVLSLCIHRSRKTVDVADLESTYAGRGEGCIREVAEADLVGSILRTLRQGGIAVPFALGNTRAQEIWQILHDHPDAHEIIASYPIYFDGTSAVEIAEIFLRSGTVSLDQGIVDCFISSLAERKRIVDAGKPCVIITTAGMCDLGPAPYYISRLASNRLHSFILTCYQAPSTLGRKMLDAVRGDMVDVVCINEEVRRVPLWAEVVFVGLSSHIRDSELRALMREILPRDALLTHVGDEVLLDRFIETFRPESRMLGIKVQKPIVGQVFSI